MSKNVFQKWLSRYWDEVAVYAFTVLCVFLGGYILHGEVPEHGWLPVVAALVVAGILCLAVEVLSGTPDTPEKIAAKKKSWPKRMLFSALAGLGSGAIVPALVKIAARSMGIEL